MQKGFAGRALGIKLLALVLGLGAVGASSGAAASSGSAGHLVPVALKCQGAPATCSGLVVRPGSVGYSEAAWLAGAPKRHGDMGKLRWSTWGSGHAVGSGYDWHNSTDCGQVVCAATHYAVKVRLDRPRHEHGYWLFTRMRITYLGKHRPSSSRVRTLHVTFVNDGFNWGPAFP